jgi:1,4-dihydroxy-2-naphthoate octaprenyltransferase
MRRQLLLLLVALVAGTALALLFGAKNLGTALAIGQLCFAAVLVYVLMRD